MVAIGVFTQKDEIERLARELEREVQRRFEEVVRMDAEEIAERLIDEKGLDDVCRDIEEAIDEAEPMIHYSAETNATYTYDNYLLATFAPYYEGKELVDEELVGLSVCGESEFNMDRAVTVYAFELWRGAITEKLKEILKEKCSKVGRLRSVLAKVKG